MSTLFAWGLRPHACLRGLRASSLAFAMVLCACGPLPDPSAAHGPKHGVALLHSDYQSTVLGLADPATGAVVAPVCIHSGSARGALTFGLSGDVVLASQPWPDGTVTLLDRMQQTLLWVDPQTCRAVRQISIATHFAANPQDVAFIAPNRAYVTRHQRNSRPQRGPFDAGDDILVIDPQSGAFLGTINLHPFADPGLWARPARMQRIGPRVYVSLLNMSDDFSRMGPGRIAVIDSASDTVVDVWDLPHGKNCFDLQQHAASGQLAVTCMGPYGDAEDAATLWLAGYESLPCFPTRAWSPSLASGTPPRLGIFGTAWLDDAALVVLSTHPTQGHQLSQVDTPGLRAVPVLQNIVGAWETLAVDGRGPSPSLWVSDGTPAAPQLMRLERDAHGVWQKGDRWGEAIGHGMPVRQIGFY